MRVKADYNEALFKKGAVAVSDMLLFLISFLRTINLSETIGHRSQM